ncbi:hypothetical protein PY650_24000 [Rhizobium calliandrae]|uniref:Uncharacterized protein n=1 Tax=Rhizobium calliandrae TaxID=1312182 RepID=A0ABT7KJB4_9HYPH|nr:hypothetical protein [Rhizobium calliandrae]MDL2408652.1 hypothetical protein [Rhizobium calliandrae]
MNATTISNWASRNNFLASGPFTFHRYDKDRRLAIEIKRTSVVVIIETVGRPPRIKARLFKDLCYDPLKDIIDGIDLAI